MADQPKPKPKYRTLEVEVVDLGAALEQLEKDGYEVAHDVGLPVFGMPNGRVVIIGELRGGTGA